MAKFQYVDVPIGAGLDQKLDQRMLPPGKVTNVENGMFTTLGSVTKRLGNELLSTTALLSSSISGFSTGYAPPMQSLTTFKDSLVGVDSGGSYAYTYSPKAQMWIQQDRVPPCYVEREGIVQGYINPDIAYYNGFLIYTFVAPALDTIQYYQPGTIYVMIVDAVTKLPILKPTTVCQRGVNPRLVVCGTNVVLMYGELTSFGSPPTGEIRMQILTNIGASLTPVINGPYSPGSHSIGGGPIQFFCMDACASSTRVYVAYPYANGATNYITVDVIDPASALVGGPNGGRLTSVDDNVYSTTPAWSIGIDSWEVDATETHVAWAWGGQISLGLFGNNLTTEWSIISDVFTTQLTGGDIFTDFTANGQTYSIFTGVAYRDALSYVVTLGLSKNETRPSGSPIATLGDDHGYTWAQLVNAGGGAVLPFSNPPRKNFWVRTLSKPFWVADPTVGGGYRAYAFGNVWWDLQGTNHVFDLGVHDTNTPLRQFTPVATTAPRLANDRGLAQLSSVGDVTFLSIGGQCSAVAVDNTVYTIGPNVPSANPLGRNIGFDLISMRFEPLKQYQPATLGRNLHLAAGVPHYYDGVNTGDIGFAYYPPVASTYYYASGTATGATIGTIANGTYQYAVTYEWTDAQGQVHQSAPSIQASVAPAQAGNRNRVEIFIPNLCVTNRNITPLSGSQKFPQAVVWRSLVGSTVLRRLTPETGVESLFCYPNSGSLIFLDTKSDALAGLATKPILYTAGGVLANFNPPSARLSCTHGERVWLAGQDNPKTVWYSKQTVDDEAIAFNDSLSFNVDEGGAVTAICGMDDKLIVFKSDRIFYVAGQGPNAAGAQNDFTSPVPIPSDVGCANYRSVVKTPDGIMFQSSIGIMLLTRATEVINIGYPVADLLKTYPVVTSAVVHPDQSQVRFTCATDLDDMEVAPYITNGVTLVYDYMAKAWSYATYADLVNAIPQNAQFAACVHDGKYVQSGGSYFALSGSIGCVLRERDDNPYTYQGVSYPAGDANAYLDATGYVNETLETAWVSANGLQGYQRVSHVRVLGEVHDACDVAVSVAIDGKDAYTTPQVYQLLGTEGKNFAFDYQLPRQNCEAVRVKLTVSSPSIGAPTSGKGFTITGVKLRVLIKEGTGRLPASRR